MAEFGVQATQLSAPRNAGANPVAPAPGLDLSAITKVGTSLFESLTSKEPEAITQYASRSQAIAQALDNGEITQSRAMTEHRKLHAEFAGRYPQYTKEIKQVHDNFMSGSSLGVAQEEEKSAAALRRQDISDAAKAGWDVPYGASGPETDAIVAAYKTKKRNQEATKDMMETLRFKREQKQWSDADTQKEIQENTAVLLAGTTGTYIEGFNAQAAVLARKVASDPKNLPVAQAELAGYFTRIKGEIASIAGVNPQLASLYNNMFDEVYNVNKKLLDPVNQAEDQAKILRAQLESVQTRIKLTALKSPTVQQAFAVNTLIGQPTIINKIGDEASQRIAVLLAQENDNPNREPVVGNPEVEKKIFDAASAALTGVMKGDFVAHKAQSEQEAIYMANNLLKEIGGVINQQKKLEPKALMASLDWASRTEVGQAAKAGKLDVQARLAAKQVFEIGMQQPLVEKINEKLVSSPSLVGWGTDKPKQVIDTVTDISFDGASVKFNFTKEAGNNPVGIGSLKKDLASTEEIVTKLVKAAAHMEGHTDYQKTWLQIRRQVFPSLYVAPEPLKQGQKVTANGETYEYLGGPDARASSWRKLPSAKPNQ